MVAIARLPPHAGKFGCPVIYPPERQTCDSVSTSQIVSQGDRLRETSTERRERRPARPMAVLQANPTREPAVQACHLRRAPPQAPHLTAHSSTEVCHLSCPPPPTTPPIRNIRTGPLARDGTAGGDYRRIYRNAALVAPPCRPETATGPRPSEADSDRLKQNPYL